MSELQKLAMAPDFKDAIFSGKKQITIRDKERRQYRKGETIEIVSADETWGCKAVLTKVSFQTYATTSLIDLEDDGFTSIGDMIEGMRTFYPHIMPSSRNTVFRWDQVFDTWEK